MNKMEPFNISCMSKLRLLAALEIWVYKQKRQRTSSVNTKDCWKYNNKCFSQKSINFICIQGDYNKFPNVYNLQIKIYIMRVVF